MRKNSVLKRKLQLDKTPNSRVLRDATANKISALSKGEKKI